MLNRAYSLFEIRSADDGAHAITLTGMATTPTADRMNDVVEPMGAQFKLPLPLLWQHKSDQPIGQVTHAEVSKAGIAIVALAVAQQDPDARFHDSTGFRTRLCSPLS